MSNKVKTAPPHIPPHTEMGVLLHNALPPVRQLLDEKGLGLTYEKYVCDWERGYLMARVTGNGEYCLKTVFDIEYQHYRVQTDILLALTPLGSPKSRYSMVETVYTGCFVNWPDTLVARIAEQWMEALNRIADYTPAVTQVTQSNYKNIIAATPEQD